MFRATGVPRFALFLAMAVVLAGCFDAPESNQDEQRDPHYLNGRRRVESQDYQGAIDEFEKALEVNPRNASAHFELGILYENYLKDYAAAIYHYEKFRQLNPKSENAEKARERVGVCKRDLAGAEFLPPTTQVIQKQLDRLTLENKSLRDEVAMLDAQLKDRAAAAARAEAQAAAARSPAQRDVPRQAPPSVNTNNGARPAPPQSVQEPSTPTAYVVASGDTMNKIARHFRVKLTDLEAANPGVDSRHLRVGQKLVIPAP